MLDFKGVFPIKDHANSIMWNTAKSLILLLDFLVQAGIIGNMDKITAWLGMASGLTGSALVASGFYLSGFILFGISNVFWIAHSLLTKNWPLAIMQAGFTATSILGIVNNV